MNDLIVKKGDAVYSVGNASDNGEMTECYIWGTGGMATKLVSMFCDELKEYKIRGFIDNDPKKWGSLFFSWRVYSPDIILNNPSAEIYICNQYGNEVIAQLDAMHNFDGKILSDNYWEKLKLIGRYRDSDDEEIQKIVSYLRDNDLDYFNYEFVKEYNDDDIEVFFDEDKHLFYSNCYGRRMYISKKFNTEKKAKTYIRNLKIEQDERSPHRYVTESFNIPLGGVVVDAGAAEGMFSLQVLDRADHIYLFEPDLEWCEALRYTFKPYSSKVTIVDKGISNYSTNSIITLDDFFGETLIDFIKMDIEGEEYYALMGAEQILAKSSPIKCLICTYHQEFEYFAINHLLVEKGFQTDHTNGYMWFDERNYYMRPYVLRRGIIKASK